MAAEHKIEVRPKNWLVPVALVIMRKESSYGYELMGRLEEEFECEKIRAATLYRTLRYMENEGLCKSEWDTSKGGPPRRMYAITDAGESYLAAWAEACKRYQQIIDSFYRAYTTSRHPHTS